VASGIIVGRALLEALPKETPLAFAGHSVGEFTAAALSGVLSDDDAITLVALRGRAMAEASAALPTGMSAVIGGDRCRRAIDVVLLSFVGLLALGRQGGRYEVAGQVPPSGRFGKQFVGERMIICRANEVQLEGLNDGVADIF
jgi:[acyl-carrier-protein] S-malonyltransferase